MPSRGIVKQVKNRKTKIQLSTLKVGANFMKIASLEANFVALVTLFLIACTIQPEHSQNSQIVTEDQPTQGKLILHANGEDFVREGFTSKDGWQISFEHVYVNLADVTAYQTNPPFNPETDEKIQATTKVLLVDAPITVDLATALSKNSTNY